MDAPDGQVPAPRRAGPLDAASETCPRVPELHALLGEIDGLRLTLQADLSLAAAAVEAGADALAVELVEGDLAELHRFATSAGGRLARLDGGEPAAGEPAAETPTGVPAVPLRRRRVLSGAPLMAAAAALVGFVALGPSGGQPSPQQTSMTSAALAGYELDRLVSEGAPDEQLRLVAEELNDSLAVLIAQAGDDPVAAQQALLLLEKTTAVLSSQGDSGVLRGVLAETAALRAKLREALPVVVQRPARTNRPARPPVRVVVPLLPRVQEEPEKERSNEPSAAPKPSAKPSPSPSAAPPSPSPSPSPEPSSSPGGDPEQGPLPKAPGGDLPGV